MYLRNPQKFLKMPKRYEHNKFATKVDRTIGSRV